MWERYLELPHSGKARSVLTIAYSDSADSVDRLLEDLQLLDDQMDAGDSDAVRLALRRAPKADGVTEKRSPACWVVSFAFTQPSFCVSLVSSPISRVAGTLEPDVGASRQQRRPSSSIALALEYTRLNSASPPS